MTMQIENIGDFLKSNNIKPSYQRIKIYEYLMGTTAHPTVDTIYRALLPEIPTLSKPRYIIRSTCLLTITLHSLSRLKKMKRVMMRTHPYMDILNVTTVALCLTLKQIYLIYWHHNLRDAKSQKSTFTSVVYAVRVLRKLIRQIVMICRDSRRIKLCQRD